MTNAEIHVSAYRAINTLQTRAISIAKEHRERIKRIREVARHIEHKSASGQLELAVDSQAISPELLALITNPTQGL
jgi:hypothetical protein